MGLKNDISTVCVCVVISVYCVTPMCTYYILHVLNFQSLGRDPTKSSSSPSSSSSSSLSTKLIQYRTTWGLTQHFTHFSCLRNSKSGIVSMDIVYSESLCNGFYCRSRHTNVPTDASEYLRRIRIPSCLCLGMQARVVSQMWRWCYWILADSMKQVTTVSEVVPEVDLSFRLSVQICFYALVSSLCILSWFRVSTSPLSKTSHSTYIYRRMM